MDQGAKALVCYADKKPILIVLPCSRKLDFELFKKLYTIKDLRFATPEEVKILTSLEIGAIPPLGYLFNLPTYVDEKLGENKTIAFNAGDRTKSVIMSYSDYAPLSQNQKYRCTPSLSPGRLFNFIACDSRNRFLYFTKIRAN